MTIVTLLFALLILCHTSEGQEYDANKFLRPRIRRDVPSTSWEQLEFDLEGDQVVPKTIQQDEEGNGEASPNIVGGEEASLGEYPYFVDFGYCGGSLIAPNLVLTAAHCRDAVGSFATVGAYRKGDAATPGATTVRVVDWRRHPYFDDVNGKYDVAIVKIEPSVYLNTDIVLKLNEQENLMQGEPLTVMGMGVTEEDGEDLPRGSPLIDAVLEYIPNAVCNDRWWYDEEVDYTSFCAGYREGGKDACQGDSGNPLVRKVGSTHVQVGIVSWGDGCGEELSPGVYARVDMAYRWIQTVGCVEWRSSGPLCDVRTSNNVGRVVGSKVSCEWNEKQVDLTILTGETAGDIRWEIISVEQEKTIFTQMGLENWETYQTRKCLPQSAYVLLIKNFRGNGLSGGGYSLTVDGRLVEEAYDNEQFKIKVVKF